MPPSLHYRKCDDARHWNLFMIQLLQIMNLATLEDLYEAVIANGWYPANRNAAAGPALDVHIVNAFADANGYEHPEDYRETAPTHVAMLVNWRVLRYVYFICIPHLTAGLTIQLTKRAMNYQCCQSL